MDFGVCSGTEISDENPRKRQIECHLKYDPKVKGKDIIYPFCFILLAYFPAPVLHKGELGNVRTIPGSSYAVMKTFTPHVINR